MPELYAYKTIMIAIIEPVIQAMDDLDLTHSDLRDYSKSLSDAAMQNPGLQKATSVLLDRLANFIELNEQLATKKGVEHE